MKIYLDFDDTILNTGAFVKELIRIFGEAGFTADDFYRNYERTKNKVGDFDLDTIFQFFAESGDFDVRKIRRKVDTIFANVDVFVYNDFFDFAKEFGKEKLGIVSFGTTASQREKIENSKIIPYFSEVIVTPKSKEEDFIDIVKTHSDKQIFFVEDKADQVDKVKRATPQVIAMKIERPDGRYIDSKSELADFVVRDFYEVEKIIKSKI